MIKLAFGLCKATGVLVGGCFSLIGAALGSSSKPSSHVRTANPASLKHDAWWDYDRNALDNDIEQFRHTDGLKGN